MTISIKNNSQQELSKDDDNPTSQSRKKPSQHKYLKSTFSEPGQRIIHPGLLDDFPPNHDTNKIFGKRFKDSDHVNDIFIKSKNPVEIIKCELKESKYISSKREPLGKSYNRGHVLPEFMKEETFRHGVKSEQILNGAKELLYPEKSCSSTDVDESIRMKYVKSHGSYLPGEQKRRDYQWSVNPVTTTFGVKGVDKKLRVSSQQVHDVLHFDYGADVDKKARGRTCEITDNIVFGKTTKMVGSTKECLQKWDAKEEVENDLGKSVIPGFRNAITIERKFGCPSIRTDIPKYARHSVADMRNYGDDVNASYLLKPSQFSNLGLGEDEFQKPRSKDEIKSLFEKCGYEMRDEVFEHLWKKVSGDDEKNKVGIEAFREEYNEWLFPSKEEETLNTMM